MTPQRQRKCFQKSFLVGQRRGYGMGGGRGAADKERGGRQGDGSISGGNFWEIGKEEEETPFWSSSLSSCFAAAAAGSKRKEGKRGSCSSQKF